MATNGNHAADTRNNTIDPEKFKRLFFTPVVPFLHDDPYTIDYDGYRSFIRRFGISSHVFTDRIEMLTSLPQCRTNTWSKALR